MTDQNKENESKELMHEAHEAIERLRAACPLGNVRTPMHIAQHFIDHTSWLDENLERAKKRNNLLCTEQDQLREALDIDATVDLVEHVQALKDAQCEAVPEQVMALQGYIKARDEQWNKVCEALGLPDMGRTLEAEVVERVRQFAAKSAKALEAADDKIDQLSRALDRVYGQTNRLCSIAGVDSDDPDWKRLESVADHLLERSQHGEHENNRIEQMNEALEQALMETSKQAQVIAELRDELKRARNSIDDLIYDAANLKGQKEAYERALEIFGGSR